MRASPLGLLRGGLLVFLVGFLAYIGWLLASVGGEGPAEPPDPGAESTEGGEAARIEAMDFVRSRGDEEELRVRARDMRAYQDGVTLLDEPKIFIPSERGELPWQAVAETGEQEANPYRVRLQGEVVVTRGEDERLEADALHYDEEKDLVRSHGGEVRIRSGGISSRADHLLYRPDAGRAILEGGVRGTLDSENGTRARFSGRKLTYDRAGGEVLIQGGVKATFDRYELGGRELQVLLDEDGRAREGWARGGALVERRDGEGRLEGERIRFEVVDEEIRGLEAEGAARARMATREEHPLEVRGERIRIRLAAGGSLERLEAFSEGESRVRVTGLPGAAGGVASSRTLDAGLDQEGLVREALFEGDVQIAREEMRGFGRTGTWSRDGGMVLRGAPGVHAPRGKAYGEEVRVLSDGAATVRGKVHSVLEQVGRDTPLFEEDRGPVYVSADLLEVSADGSTLRYEGDPVHAKQGDNSILSRTLVLEEGAGRLEAGGGVRSKVRLSKAKGDVAGPIDPSRLVEGSSEELVYQDDTIEYRGGGRLRQGERILRGERIVLHLSKEGRGEVERIEAEGDAEAHLAPHHAWGDALSYVASSSLLTVYGTGGPARAEDRSQALSGSGKVLTLNLDSGTFSVETDPRARTLSSYRAGGETAHDREGSDGDAGPAAPDGRSR